MSEKAADAESDAQKTANLARIRDNQRRSRARRNEYLKDLESKYRKCEQVGASASAEIQAAARGVAEENRRLRDLLKAYGVPDAEIDRASGRQGSVAASSLEAMASSRRPCGDDTGCSNSPVLNVPAIQPRPIQQAQPQQNQQPSSSSQPNLCPRPTLEIPQTIATPQYPNQMLSPCSLPGRKQSYDQDLPPPMLQDHHPDPNNPFPTFGLPMDNQPDHHQQQQQLSAHDFPDPNSMDFHQDPSDPMAQGHHQYDDLSSCRIAANTIRTFSPNAGYELEQELGCSAPGEECAVPSLRMFNVLDRYTGGSG